MQTIRLEKGWYSMLARSKQVLALDDKLTVKGLAVQLDLDPSQVYRLIYNQTVDPDAVSRDPHSGVYLIRNDPALIERLRNRSSKKMSSVKQYLHQLGRIEGRFSGMNTPNLRHRIKDLLE